MGKSDKKFKGKKASGTLRLIRYLKKGDKLIVKGTRGRTVKTFRPDRKYVLEVHRRGKLYGYINNVNTKNKITTPKPQSFTRSMISRLKNVYQGRPAPITSRGKVVIRLVSSRRITSQITKKSKLIREIKANSGKAFSLKVDVEGMSDDLPPTWPIYYKDDGRLSDDELKKLIQSNFFMLLGQNKLRISDRLRADGTIVNSNRRLVEKADLQLLFSEVPEGKKRDSK